MKQLETYRQKRDFRKTSEPSGDKQSRKDRSAPIFIVQKHDARNLHYDFRLEIAGVLKSWAIPKGPSDKPGERRLAVMVEDHPLDYGDFEGVIPEGEYGAGPVLLWDRGTWEIDGSPAKALERGTLKLTLHGEKMNGRWTLTRMKSSDDNQWLLIKGKDRWANADATTELVDRYPASVKSERLIEEVAAGTDPSPKKTPGGKPAASLPDSITPELATLCDSAPTGDDWLHEIKYDGYRIIARKQNGNVRLISRNDNDWTARFEPIAKALTKLGGDVALDGEVVVTDEHGVTSFQALQQVLAKNSQDRLLYYVFDLLWLNGVDLRDKPLIERKQALRELLERFGSADTSPIRYSDHVTGNGDEFLHEACANHLEGIISKRADSPYRGRRTMDWRKIKCTKRQEFLIGGFTEPSGSRTGFGALLLGHFDDSGELQYAGRVGTGFNDATLKRLRAKLDKLTRKTSAFAKPPQGQEAQGVTWVNPELVAEVAFTEWTDENRLRHPSYQGLREDKPVNEVFREDQAPPPSETRKPSKKHMNVLDIEISNPNRTVFPDAGITKGQVAAYYAEIAERMLPYIADRPLSVVRCPEGRHKSCFYQKHRSTGMPESIASISINENDESDEYLTINTPEGIVALAQFAVLEIHPWLARNDRLDRPDLMVFDLDPAPDVSWEEVLGAAFLLRDLLEDFDLIAFPKLTGGKGIHLVVPIQRRHDFDLIKPAAKAIAERLREMNRGKFLTSATKAKRNGKIFIDYLRNGRGATAVAPFSLRGLSGATVATPVSWDELSPDLKSNHFTFHNIAERLATQENDPWRDYFKVQQSLAKSALRDLGIV